MAAAAAGDANGSKQPWYKAKFARAKYLKWGDPIEVREEELPEVVGGWVWPDEVEKKLWKDAKDVVDSRQKKRDYLIEYKITETESGTFKRTIEALNLTRRGFRYSIERYTTDDLERDFWSVVSKLFAHYFSPKITAKPELFD